MKFHQTAPDENFKGLRMVSEGGQWEVGLCPVFFGVRVRAGRVGDGACAIDLCAGADKAHIDTLLKMVLTLLSPFSESARAGDVSRLIPSFETKPVFNDEKFMREFTALCANAAKVAAAVKSN